MTENLRHHYAAAALSGLVSQDRHATDHAICKRALAIADTMLAVLEPLPENDPLGRNEEGVSSGMQAWLKANRRKMEREPKKRHTTA